MVKNIWTLLILFSTAISFGQDIILQKNTHPRTKELKHNLNRTRDSLIMSCESSIFKVDIFNEDYEKVVIVEDSEVSIPLTDLPAGRFVVEAQLSDKIVVMHLIRRDYMQNATNANLALGEQGLAKATNRGLEGSQTAERKPSHHSLEFLLSGRRSKQVRHKNQKSYWTLAIVNTGNNSSKTMRLTDRKTADKMISRHQLESKSFNARFNELIIWEVYDTSKFMEHQYANPDYINSSASEFFNVSPYYTSEHNFE